MNRVLSRVIHFRLWRYLCVSKQIRLKRMHFRVPLISGLGFDHLDRSDSWMVNVLEALEEFLTEGTFVDVGANIGQTLLALRAISQRRYLGFEPNPACVFYLQQLIRENQFADTEIVPVGVANKTELMRLNFFQTIDTDTTASLDPAFRPRQQIHSFRYVPVVDHHLVDSLLSSSPALIKIDVEGFEAFVLEGLEPIVCKSRPIILLEILPAYTKDNSERIRRQETIENYLRRLSYRLYRIKKQGDRFFGLDPIESVGIHSDLNQSDYVAAPLEAVSKLQALIAEGPPQP